MLELAEGFLKYLSIKVGNFVARIIKDPLNYEENSDGSAILGLIIVVVTLSTIGFIAAWLRQ